MPTKVKKVKVKAKKEIKQKQKQKQQKQTQIVNINIADKKKNPRTKKTNIPPTPSIQRLNQAYQATPTIINNIPMPQNELLNEMRNIVLQHLPQPVPIQTTVERERNFIRNANDLNRVIQPEIRRQQGQAPQTPPIQRRNDIEEEPLNVYEAGALVPVASPKPQRSIFGRAYDVVTSPFRRRRNRDIELGDIEDDGAGVLFRGDGGAGGNGGIGGVGDRGVGGIVGNEGARDIVYYRGNREVSTIINRVIGEVGIDRFRRIGGGRPMGVDTAQNNVRVLGRRNDLDEAEQRRLHRSIYVLLHNQGTI